jgi:type I restriction enzyme S subunit
VSTSIVSLGEISHSIVDGPFGSNLKTSDYVETGVPVLQGKNITGDEFVWKDIRYITSSKARELARSSVEVGDHLVIKIGSIGYSAIIDNLNGHAFAIIPANLARIRPNRKLVNDSYLHHWLVSEEAKRYFIGVASKTAQPALSLTKIKEARLPLPSLEEQRRIAAILDKTEMLRRRYKTALKTLGTLYSSLQERAFTGQL